VHAYAAGRMAELVLTPELNQFNKAEGAVT
jgi:hypothetical protein